MQLASDDGTVLVLRVLGYEFSFQGTERHNSWLDISLTLLRPSETWERTDPALLAGELREMAFWLLGVAVGRTPLRLVFTEPCLSFELVLGPPHGKAVRIYLSHELRPPWEPTDFEIAFYLTFPVKRLAFLRAGLSLLVP